MSIVARLLPARRTLALLGVATAALASNVGAQTAVDASARPRIAIMEFDNGAMVKHDEFAGLTSGIQVLLSNALGANPNIQVVERQQIQTLLKEQDLGTSGRLDATTAARVGKLLGATHIVLGGFIVQPDMQMRLVVRAVNSETGVQEYTEQVEGSGNKVLKLVDELSNKVNSGLKLPGARDSKAVKEQGLTGPNQLEATKAYGFARILEEKGDLKGAAEMYRKALQANGEFGMARSALASMERTTPR